MDEAPGLKTNKKSIITAYDFFLIASACPTIFIAKAFSSLFSELLLLPVEPMTQTIGYHGVAECRGFSFSSFKWGKTFFMS